MTSKATLSPDRHVFTCLEPSCYDLMFVFHNCCQSCLSRSHQSYYPNYLPICNEMSIVNWSLLPTTTHFLIVLLFVNMFVSLFSQCMSLLIESPELFITLQHTDIHKRNNLCVACVVICQPGKRSRTILPAPASEEKWQQLKRRKSNFNPSKCHPSVPIS